MLEPASSRLTDPDRSSTTSESASIDSSTIALKVLSGADALLGYWGTNLRCQFANPAYETWFGKSRRN